MHKQILSKIEEYNKIIIHGHIRPDGDCYGSQFGLKEIIKANYPNKEVYVVGQVSGFASFLGDMDEIDDKVYEGALAIVVDTGAADRISDQRVNLAEYIIKIDHHIPVGEYGDLIYVMEEKPACSQIITDFALKCNLEISPVAAKALYVGIITDTGRFKYRGVDKETFQIAGELVERGVDIEEVDYHLGVEGIESIHLKGYVYSSFKTTENGVIYVEMPREIISKFQVTDEVAASQVNLLSAVYGYPVWCLFIEYPTEIRIRMRSRGPNVDKLANKYNGGGHAKAAGASLKSWEDVSGFLVDFDRLVKDYKESTGNDS